MLKELDVRDDAPWKQRFRAPAIAWSAVASQNPERGVVCTNRDGIFQLYAWDVPSGKLTRVTDQPAGVMMGVIAADGNSIYYHQDAQGNEIGHYVRVPFTGGEPENITPDRPPYASHTFSQSKTGRVTGFTSAGMDGFHIFTRIGADTFKPIYHSGKLTFGPTLSYDGEVAVVTSRERSGTLDASLVAIDVASGEQIGELWDGEETNMRSGAFSPVAGDLRVLATSNQSGYGRPLIWNPRSGERTDLTLDDIPGEVTPWDWSPDAERILLCQLYQANYQLYVYTVADGRVTRLNHPAGVVGGFSGGDFTPDGDILLTWQDSAHPAQLILLDGQSGEQKRVVLEAGSAPAGIKWHSVSFASTNGSMIQGWLATPQGDGPFPTILHTHGGPTSVMADFYAPMSQAWLDHGFAFLTINYHGSITFGKAFEKSIWGNLGQLEVDDMAAAYQWLVTNGIAQPDAVLLTGGSYGGYLTLQALGKRPDLWAGGMAQVAIADWRVMYEDEAETLRGYQRALFGGTPDETPEATRAGSPITYAEQVKAPILVIQGSNDTRCPARQMQAYEQKLNELGKSIHVHWFDAGHGSRAMEQQIEHQEHMLRFAYRVLG
ncbi:MAG: S9 family peptidase [Anaerolineaceae bacterium]|nr:S9 family peptidase [Anaerolineaceae bacterium]